MSDLLELSEKSADTLEDTTNDSEQAKKSTPASRIPLHYLQATLLMLRSQCFLSSALSAARNSWRAVHRWRAETRCNKRRSSCRNTNISSLSRLNFHAPWLMSDHMRNTALTCPRTPALDFGERVAIKAVF